MKLNIIKSNIYHLTFPTQKCLTFTMCRVQEFYEASSNKLRGSVFSWSTFIDECMNDAGEIDYFHFWAGFNIPGDVFVEWANKFIDKSPQEKALESLVTSCVSSSCVPGDKFYIIASREDDTSVDEHEIAHAMYYINPAYKAHMLDLNLSLDTDVRKIMIDRLIALNYSTNVLDDELQAYLSTSDYDYMKDQFGFDENEIAHIMLPYQQIFHQFK